VSINAARRGVSAAEALYHLGRVDMGIVVRLGIAAVLRARIVAIRMKINGVCLGVVFESRCVVHINETSNQKSFSSGGS
jgi:hypothetical protein